MTKTPDRGAEPDEPAEGVGEEFAGLTPEEFLARTAGSAAAEPAVPADGHEGQQDDPLAVAQKELAERTEDLQRLQAEYVNYRKRVERDRDVARIQGVESIVRDLMPVLDAIGQAEAHGELTGGFKLVADELTRVTAGHGLAAFGEPGDGKPVDGNLTERWNAPVNREHLGGSPLFSGPAAPAAGSSCVAGPRPAAPAT